MAIAAGCNKSNRPILYTSPDAQIIRHIVGMTKPDPTLTGLPVFMRHDVEKSDMGYAIGDRRTADPIAWLCAILAGPPCSTVLMLRMIRCTKCDATDEPAYFWPKSSLVRLYQLFVRLTNNLIYRRFSMVVPVLKTTLRANVELDGDSTRHVSLVGTLSESDLPYLLNDARLLAEYTLLRFPVGHLHEHLRTCRNDVACAIARSNPNNVQSHPIGLFRWRY